MNVNASNIRIIGVPLDLGAGHRGVDMGPSAIRVTKLKQRLEELGYHVNDSGDITTAVFESIGIGDDARMRHANTVLNVNTQLASQVAESLEDGEFPLVIGGDHSIAIGSLAGAATHFANQNQSLGVIWIDAHADMNSPETTPSGNIHGMSLAISLGLGDSKFTNLYNDSTKINGKNVVLVGIRDLDEAEREVMHEYGLTVFTMRDIDELGMPEVMSRAIEIVSHASAGIYVQFDMDSIDPDDAPGTGTPVPGGLTYREAHLAMERLHETGKIVGVDLVETNPALDTCNKTAEVGTQMLLSLLGKKIYRRPGEKRTH